METNKTVETNSSVTLAVQSWEVTQVWNSHLFHDLASPSASQGGREGLARRVAWGQIVKSIDSRPDPKR
jgi:hypothetical protein